MTKDKFSWLVSNYTSLEQDDADELIQLLNRYPYSQVINNLVARAALDLALPDKKLFLHKSAVYSTDRSVLKSIMTSPRENDLTPFESKKHNIKKQEVFTSKPADVDPIIPSAKANHTDDIYRQVEIDLAQLKVTKLHFMEVLEAIESNKAIPLSDSTADKAALDSQGSNDGVIEKIKSSKLKMKPEGPKQQQQIDIIDEFIKTQPTISKPKSVSSLSSTEDLSEKVDQYGDDIVSETLVEILLKQGKREKAVEMLKKLIWKFPQKKAYFAAQIEGLKK